MRVATWNVNSLKARIEKVLWWLERAKPDVLLMQETKIKDADAPHEAFGDAGYELTHHGQGGRNGVAIASRYPFDGIITLPDARGLLARCGEVVVMSIYAPNGRTLESSFYQEKLAWYDALHGFVAKHRPTIIGGDFNVAPTDADVWDPALCHGGTHVSPRERSAFQALLDAGYVDAYRLHHADSGRYTWWDYRAGAFFKNEGMRIDHLLIQRALQTRVAWSEIDREARKGQPTPSDHTPLVLDLDTPGAAFDAGWSRLKRK